jgi:ElaB/YqjD/DUF883 family membrane-anchored ribosome-binding protein
LQLFGDAKLKLKQTMKTTQEVTPDKLTRDLHELVEDGEDLLKAGASRLNEQAQAKLSQAMEAAKATGVKLKDKALQSARSTDETIREFPYQSIGIAFGVGVLIGVLVHRR